jgi:septal ring-binding cell division protein DamX
MDVVATDVERYSHPNAFAKEVNLPLLGTAALPPVRPGANLSELLAASSAPAGSLEPIVENLAQTRQSLTLRSLLLAGFPHDPECFALGLALGRAWSRRGLKVLVVDLDAWHPTILRGVGEPAEGLVDVLEYGCSFQRVAWELVAGSLWVVGPGMHPAEEARLADHSEWDRAARVFSARADVTLYVAPLLHKPGLTGRLSKRMDGVLLTASVDRVSRVELRDAFLELWGSDAPIIGCVGIDPRATPADVGRGTGPGSGRAERALPVAPTSDVPEPPSNAARIDEGESALVTALEREVRLGAVSDHARARRRRTGGWVWGGVVAVTAVVAGVAAWIGFLEPRDHQPVATDTRPAGDESVLPPATSPPAPVPAATTPPAPIAARLGSTDAGVSGTAGVGAAGVAGTAAVGTPPPNAGVGTLHGGAPLTTAPPADGKKFRVHVASFRSEDKVAPIVRGLRLKGLDAWYERAADDSGWYRVFVGRFATEDEARAYASWLLQNKWVDRANAFPSTSR